MKKIALTQLQALFRKIAEVQDLYLPVKKSGKTDFAAYEEDAEVDIETLKTVKSAKEVFFPQSEDLYKCYRKGKSIKIDAEELASSDFVVFGVKGCDVQGIAVLDRVFLVDPVDTFYAARREHGTIVSLACNEPETSCFCRTFGIDAAAPEGDVTTWMADGNLYWQANTEKGETLTAAVADLLEDTDDSKVEETKTQITSIIDQLPNGDLDLEGWGAGALDTRFESQVWEDMYKACLACGTCTFVCPTCQCYDIKDYNTGTESIRYRCWDSCMYSDFTMMAGGNNRKSQMQRFRQRFMHKLCYYPANNDGVFSCVGCGRCVDRCPSHLNIVKVIKAFQKEAEK